MDTLLYISNVILYIALLATSGLIIANSLLGMKWEQPVLELIKLRTKQLSKFLFIAVLFALCVQSMQWIEIFGIDSIQWKEVLLNTSTGKSLTYLFVLALVGLFLKRFDSMFGIIWAWVILFGEAMNGHIAALESSQVGTLFDYIHLFCAAIWIGGVIILWIIWRNEKSIAAKFMIRFSKILWVTLALVAISGVLLTILILPSWMYLLYTSWGKWLLIKIVVISLAIGLGYLARIKIVKHHNNPKRAMLTEAILLVAIIMIASLISQISPMPNMNNPLNVHRMGDELHYTVKLTPNAPGPNQLSVTLWTLEEEGEVATVDVSVVAEDKPSRSERDFELVQADLEDEFAFDNFNESRFVMKDLQLPYPSNWQAKVMITFLDGHKRSFDFTFSND
ncbi:copper resistance D family protein [Paenibacillus endoradicis]|uniref:copper resistance D family protein n=1 Tax=Paenibacillus endoradicis TaxID=2972487 RepID=UPI002159B4BF|nr:CopD family protein [Paenibacillus endoradicis]MCR8657919.1 CopD family protein [Paenibacillus endoradicis]